MRSGFAEGLMGPLEAKTKKMSHYSHEANSIEETERLGVAVAKSLPERVVVGLIGTLGAGKTRFVQAIASEFGVPREHVVSPTFVLCQQYEADRTIYHLDAYRLFDGDEFLSLGPEEFFAATAVTFIEWADRIEDCLPAERLMISIEVVDETSRRFRFIPHGAAANETIARLRKQLGEL